MIGQTDIVSWIYAHNIDNSPKITMFLGETGSGKHELSKLISEHLKLDIIDISENINSDTINEIYSNPIPKIYLINLDNLNEKQQNTILKFIEEPIDSSFVILVSSNANMILETIENRCYKIKLKAYSKDELSQFIKDNKYKDFLLNICMAPGQIISLQDSNCNLNDLYSLCNKVVNDIDKATLSNALSIINNLNITNVYDKYDLKTFMKTIEYIVMQNIDKLNFNLLFITYNITEKYLNRLNDNRLNTTSLMTNYIIELWEERQKLNRGKY